MPSLWCQNVSTTSKPNSFQLEDLKLLPILIICIFGMFTNIMSVIILTNSKIRNYSTFKYMLATSTSNFLYLLLIMPNAIEYCSAYCSFILNTYWYNFYRLYLCSYLTSSIAIFSTLIDIALSLQHYQIITNKSLDDKTPFKRITFSLSMISILYFLPLVFLNFITKCKHINQEQFIIQNSDSNFKLPIEIILHSIRLVLVFVILTIINILNCIKYNKLTKNKIIIKNLNKISVTSPQTIINNNNNNSSILNNNNDNKRKKKLILMIIVKSVINFICLIPMTIYLALNYGQIYFDNSILKSILFYFSLLSYSLNLFVYYWFNSLFKSILKFYFKFLFKK
jgi:hypothetical protein